VKNHRATVLAVGLLLNLAWPIGAAEITAPGKANATALPAGALARLDTTRWRQPGGAAFLTFLTEGRRLLAISPLGTAFLRDAATGQVLQTFGVEPTARPLGTQFHAAAVSPDGRLLALGVTGEFGLCVYDLASAQSLWRVPGVLKRMGPRPLGFSPDGRSLILVTPEGVLSLREAATGKEQRQLLIGFPLKAAHNTRLSFAPVGGLAAVAADDGIVYLFDAATGQLLRQFGTADRLAARPYTNVDVAPAFRRWQNPGGPGLAPGRDKDLGDRKRLGRGHWPRDRQGRGSGQRDLPAPDFARPPRGGFCLPRLRRAPGRIAYR
jgi:hypothetical protein